MAAIPEGYLLPRRRTAIVVGSGVLAIMLASFANMMILAAVPQVATDLHGISQYAWIFTGYFVASTVSVPLWGKLSDTHGRRPLLAAAIACFTVGSAVCGAAPTITVLILGRALQGLGAGGIVPIAMTVTADLIAPRLRGKWEAYLGSAMVASSLSGPGVGGWLSDTVGWRWTFFALVPLGLVVLGATWVTLRYEAPRRQHRLDYPGAALLSAGLLLGLLATGWGGTRYAWASGPTVSLFACSAALLAAFGWWERRAREPIVPLALFRNRTFAAAQAAIFCSGATYFGAQTYIPLLVQGALGRSAASSGAILTPFMVSSLVTGMVAGQFVSRTGSYRAILLAAPIVTGSGFFLLTRLSTGLSTGAVVRDVLVVGVGVGLASSMLGVLVQNTVSNDMLGVASAANQFSRVIGGTIMLSVLGAVLTSQLTAELALRLPAASAHRSTVELLGDHAHATAVHASFAHALPHVFVVLIGVSVAMFAATLAIERKPLRRSAHVEPEAGAAMETADDVAPAYGTGTRG